MCDVMKMCPRKSVLKKSDSTRNKFRVTYMSPVNPLSTLLGLHLYVRKANAFIKFIKLCEPLVFKSVCQEGDNRICGVWGH